MQELNAEKTAARQSVPDGAAGCPIFPGIEILYDDVHAQKYTMQRPKGLGENDPEMMNLTTMNPKTRRLIQVKPGDVERTAEMFDTLLGDNLAGRKDYIAEHGSEYMDDLDVS